MLSGPSVCEAAPGMVSQAPGRHGAVCGESAEEVRGHRAARLRDEGLARVVGRAQKRDRLLGRTGRAYLSPRQPAYEAVPVLGLARARGEGGVSRRAFSLRGVYAAEDHAAACQRRTDAIVYLFHLAPYEA